MPGILSNKWHCLSAFLAGIFALTVIVTATATPSAAGASKESPTARMISDLKIFVNDGNFVLFYNELMEADRILSDPNSDAKQLARFIVVIWEQDEASVPNLNWENAKKDEFRISAAASLTMGARDGWVSYDQAKLNQYYREKTKSDSPFVAATAILHLGVSGSDEDAALLKKLSKSEPGFLARMAIRSLGMLCSQAGEEALKQLMSELSDEESQALASETLKKYYAEERGRHCY